ncbi:MAG: hypothetical protein J7496_08655 [Novosphingobium sp.]|nr:hypothetical protein [Novosphingobium sp.]
MLLEADPFAGLEHEPLDETPLFFVEKPDGDAASEIQRIVMFKRLLRLAAPKCWIVGIPNAGKRGQWALNQAKREGAVWGFPDMMVLAPSANPHVHIPVIAYLEWKDGKGRPASHQIDALNRLHRMGFPCGVFRQAETALRFLREQGFPFDA